jgi:hypothetical protein
MAGAEDSFTNIDELQLARPGAVELARGTVLAGRYEIEATLGRGGAGVVLRAHDRELREAVAIKVLRPDLGHASRWIERLAREVKLARQLRHPNVCRVFDFEKADGHVFIVMELATGGTLRREIDDGVLAKRPLEARVADARAVAAGLAAIHEAGIAHRDVTPQNVLRMADGRLVVSDFGLATEVSQTTTSIHGGTLAYMAPELVRGQRASFTSDVWALGVVVHEIVFGQRPDWSRPVGGSLVAPIDGRTLSRGERVAFSVCRACTAELPSQRPRSARQVEEWLGGQRPVEGNGGLARRALVGLGLVGAALVGARALVGHGPRSAGHATAAAAGQPPVIAVEPGGRDLSAASRVIATVEGGIQCLLALSDHRTLRYVGGSPAKAMDLDTRSGEQRPSPLAPEAFRNGCPQVSPDGKRVLYQGYLPDGSAQAFVSERPDGSEAVPIVHTADPSMSSEPKWTLDGASFIYDADVRRAGAFSMVTRRATILPEPTREAYAGSFKFVTAGRVFVSAYLTAHGETELAGFSWPSLVEDAHVRVASAMLDLVGDGDRYLFSSRRWMSHDARLAELDVARGRARELGGIPGQIIREPTPIETGIAFRSTTFAADIWTRNARGELEQLTHDIPYSEVTSCGDGYLAAEPMDDGLSLVLLDRAGQLVRRVSHGKDDHSPSCGPGGSPLYFIRGGEGESLYRCDEPTSCRPLAKGSPFDSVAASPDGKRLLFYKVGNAGPVTSWISSDGGPAHDIALSDTICHPGWSSKDRIWISRRKARGFVWTEVDVDTGRETGRSVAGTRNCSDGGSDPASPVAARVQIRTKIVSQIRLLPTSELAR